MAVVAPNEHIKKKSLFQNYPEAYARAQEAIGQGIDRYALLEQMHQIYYGKNDIASLIAGIPVPALADRFCKYNKLLILLIRWYIVILVIETVLLVLGQDMLDALQNGFHLFTVIMILRAEFPGLSDFKGQCYRPMALLSFAELLFMLCSMLEFAESNLFAYNEFTNNVFMLIAVVGCLILLMIGSLSLYLARAMFPHIGWRRPRIINGRHQLGPN